MTLIQYVIVRGDLMKVLKWNIGKYKFYVWLQSTNQLSTTIYIVICYSFKGAVITQCCHAVAAVNQLTKDDELTKSYLSEQNLDSMHKCVLQVNLLDDYLEDLLGLKY